LRIWLTQAGKELESVLPPIVVQLGDTAMEGMSHRERELFAQLVDQAIANLS